MNWINEDKDKLKNMNNKRFVVIFHNFALNNYIDEQY